MLEAIAIYLVCAGGGSHKVNGSGYGRDTPGRAITVSEPSRVSYRGQAQVEIVGQEGRIRIPHAIKPALSSGGDEGWWNLNGLDIRENEIRGQISLSPISKSRLRINRLNGRISIRGRTGKFDGDCEPYDPNNVQRKF